MNATPSFSLTFDSNDTNQTLEDILNIPLAFTKNNRRIVIIFDEF